MQFPKFGFTTIIFSFLLLNVQGAASLCAGFLPENDLKIPVGAKWDGPHSESETGGLTEARYNEVLDQVQRVYSPLVAKAGGVLTIQRWWSDATVNATATREGSHWIVRMNGGLARHPLITADAFAAVVCHEIGHHLGGLPKNRFLWFRQWSTNEGGADYFATLKCLRKVFAEDDNDTIVREQRIDPLARELCEKQFSLNSDQWICQRLSLAAQSLGKMLAQMKKVPEPAFETPDPNVVGKTLMTHPAPQCRVDTYFHGALCPVSDSVDVSETDPATGACLPSASAPVFRPLCWYKN